MLKRIFYGEFNTLTMLFWFVIFYGVKVVFSLYLYPADIYLNTVLSFIIGFGLVNAAWNNEESYLVNRNYNVHSRIYSNWYLGYGKDINMDKTNFQKIKHFQSIHDTRPMEVEDILEFRATFLAEETTEAIEAMGELVDAPQNKKLRAKVAKELVDILCVTYGALDHLGIDADAAFAEVYRSNMTKTPNPKGGKSIKGEGYSPADMERFV